MRTLLRITAFFCMLLIIVSMSFLFVLYSRQAEASGASIDPYYAGDVAATATGTSVPFSKPVNAIPGSVLVAMVLSQTATFTPPAGWTLIGSRQAFSAGVFMEIYYRVLVNGDEAVSSWTGTLGTSVQWFIEIFSLAGIDQASPIDASITGSSPATANPTLSAITTSSNNAFIVAMAIGIGVTFTPPTGMTEEFDSNGITAAVVIQPTAGSTGTKQFTSATTDYGWALVAFRKNTAASRFYFDGAATPPISPAFGTGWEQTTTSVRRVLNAVKGVSAKANTTQAVAVVTNNIDQLNVQGVLGPLAAQTISGLFKAQLLTTESSAAANMHSQMIIRLVDSAGTEKAVLYSGDATTGTTDPVKEFATTASNSYFPRANQARSLTSTAAASGDYLVVEVGARKHNTSATSVTSTVRIGESATDLGENGTTTDNSPWVEFLSGVALSGGATPTPRPHRSVIGPF